MKRALVGRPTALLPVVMSATALAIVVAYVAAVGTTPQPDEGTAARLWQLLMIGQLPIIAFFAIRWLPARPGEGLLVLALQIGAAIAAVLPVWWLGW